MSQEAVVYPTLAEDMSLARTGRIRMSDGNVQMVDSLTAYQMIDERERTNFYGNQRMDPDIVWKKKRRSVPEQVGEKNDDRQDKPQRVPEEPDGVPGERRNRSELPGFVRTKVYVKLQHNGKDKSPDRDPNADPNVSDAATAE